MTPYAEVPAFDGLLRVLYGTGKRTAGERLVLFHFEHGIQPLQPFAAETFGKLVFQRNVEYRLARIALTTGTTS